MNTKSKKNLLLIIVLILAMLLGACSSGGGAPPNAGSSAAGVPSAAPPYPSGDVSAAADGAAQMMPEAAMETEDYAGDFRYAPPGMPEMMPIDPSAGESYLNISENAPKSTDAESMLTFSLKVDTAAYTNVARYIESGNLPPADAVRTEELINYFNYDQQLQFEDDKPFAVYTEVGPSSFDSNKHMAFIRVKSKEIDKEELPRSNLTFLIDTSGSMNSYDKLPLLQDAFALLVENLTEDDRVSIVTYAGSSGVVLDSVSGAEQQKMLNALNNLSAGGSTAGAQGIQTAYALAEKNFDAEGNNRVILATDGDFNVGISSTTELERLIAAKRDSGIYLSILGFGTGNIRDDIMETLSKNGNGNYAYINNQATARKVLVDELSANLFTVADDVKAQVEFNPANVKSYRLIGYENRSLRNEDFEDDTKDAGEIGIGTDVVVMFELELHGASSGLKYSATSPVHDPKAESEYPDELFEVCIRYKDPRESESQLMLRPVTFGSIPAINSDDFNFASSVAAFGHLVRGSQYSGSADIDRVIALADDSRGRDVGGYRLEHMVLLRKYQQMFG